MRKTLLLGDYSGSNLGHNALLLSILSQIERAGAGRSVVPTLRPGVLRQVLAGIGNVDVLGIGPATLSVKFLGPPTLRAAGEAERVLLTDNLFYDRGLFHPLKNNLFALGAVLRRARRRGTPVAYYNSGVGPLDRQAGRSLVRRLCRLVDPLIVRDAESERLLRELVPGRDVHLAADSGFDMPWDRFGGGRGAGGRLGVNLSRQVLRALGGNGAGALARAMAAVAEDRGFEVVFLVTHPGDRETAERVRAAMPDAGRTEVADQVRASFDEVAAVSRSLSCVVGDRYHELVLYASAGVPIAGLDCGEKVGSLLETLDVRGCLVAVNGLTRDDGPTRVAFAVERALDGVDALRARVAEQRERSRAGLGMVLGARDGGA